MKNNSLLKINEFTQFRINFQHTGFTLVSTSNVNQVEIIGKFPASTAELLAAVIVSSHQANEESIDF